MAERTVSLRAQVGDIDPDAAFATLRDFHSYSEHVDVVREISIGVDAEGNQTSSWSVYFRSGLLEWTERDLIDEATRTMTFEQVTGDLARFDGAWQVSTGDDGVTIAFDAVVDLGIPSLADDTGLEVDALGGAPGVHSARFAGPDANDARNRRKLLDALQGHENRNARFRTVVSYVDEDGVRYFEGVCEGRIEQQERGTGGFGYDPLFTPIGETRTFAELEPDEKNALSHRGRALRAFLAFLKEQS